MNFLKRVLDEFCKIKIKLIKFILRDENIYPRKWHTLVSLNLEDEEKRKYEDNLAKKIVASGGSL
ncbi:MAG: hypothetical protein ABIF22_02930 [bacterium]